MRGLEGVGLFLGGLQRLMDLEKLGRGLGNELKRREIGADGLG